VFFEKNYATNPFCYSLLVGVFVFSFVGEASGQGGPMFTIQDLGTLGGTTSAGYSVNNSGQVAGYTFPVGDRIVHAFRWDGTTMQDLGPGQAWGINASTSYKGSAAPMDVTGGVYHTTANASITGAYQLSLLPNNWIANSPGGSIHFQTPHSLLGGACHALTQN
jgi:probable HAF family extracellular repeat protein